MSKVDANDVSRAAGAIGLLDQLKALVSAAEPVTKPAAPVVASSGASEEKGKGGRRPDYLALAEEFLSASGYGAVGAECKCRYRQGEFYYWTGTYFKKLETDFLRASVVKFLHGLEDIGNRVSNQLVSNVLLNLQGLTAIPSDPSGPVWLEPYRLSSAKNVLALRNGVLDLSPLFEKGSAIPREGLTLKPHSPRLFNYTAMDYDYDPKAAPAKWLEFLTEVLPDPGVQGLLQEWFGYCLTPDTSFQVFIMFVGFGANGKSVVCSALRGMLGVENVSSVSMQQFAAERNFQLGQTVNKLANIQGDLGAMNMAEEGQLKSFISGDPLDVDRKGRDSVQVFPTARLVFATNSPPLFKDRSSAMYRRLLYIPFNVVIPLEKRRPGMDRVEFWAEEYPAILNWAIEGLVRLRSRGHFLEPDVCKVAKGDYYSTIQPEETFIKEFIRFDADARTPTHKLFNAYLQWCDEKRISSRNQIDDFQFGKALTKFFPHCRIVTDWDDDAEGGPRRCKFRIGLRMLTTQSLEYGRDS